MSNGIEKLPLREKIGYGFGDLASCLFWMTIMSQLLYFYTDVFGLTAKAAGIMFFVSRVSDAIFDVVIGMLADRTKSRWGKFRPYILWGAVPLAVSAVLAFTTPAFGDAGKLVYAYITFIAFMFLYSTVNIPYTALLGVISGDPVERADVATGKFIGAFSAGIIVSMTALPLASYFGEGNDAKGWHVTMMIYAVAAVVFFLITFFSTKERIQPIAKEKTSVDLDLGVLVSNGPWLMLFIITILFILFVCIRMSVTTHYFKYYIGEQEITLFGKTHKFGFEWLTSAFNTVGQVTSLIGTALIPFIVRFMGRRKAAIILFSIALVCTGSFYFFKPQDLVLIFVFQALGSIVGGPISAFFWIMYADTADYSEWKTGRRSTGLIFSASIMSNKLGWAFGSMLAGFVLATTGFEANVVQNANVLNGLKAMMSVIPVGIGAVALIFLFFYNLKESFMKKVKEDLEARRLLPSIKLPQIPGILNILFSFRGRATRPIFWGSLISISLLFYFLIRTLSSLIVLFMSSSNWTAKLLIVSIIIIVIAIKLLFLWFSINIHIKRWHDLGYSGFMVLIELIPVIGWLTVIWLGFFKGNDGPNKYGLDLLDPWKSIEQNPAENS